MILGESEEYYGRIQAGRGRGRAVRATVRQGTDSTDTGNGTIILILSFIILMTLGKSEEYRTGDRRDRSTGDTAKDYGTIIKISDSYEVYVNRRQE